MGKVDVYIGGYLSINEVTKEESALLASSGCMIGMPLNLVYEAEEGTFRIKLPSGESLGLVNPKNKLAIREALEDGWGSACWLSLIWFDNSDKKFKAEVVYQFYNVKPSQEQERKNLEAYTLKTSQRLQKGQRPDVALNGTGWDQVVATGDWPGTGEQSLPITENRNSGTVILKKKRSLADRLAMSIIAGNSAARWGVTLGFTAVVLVLVYFLSKWLLGF